MEKSYKRGNEIRRFILQNMSTNSQHIVNQTAEHFNISRQAVNRHIQNLLKEGHISANGNTRKRTYALKVLHKNSFLVSLIGLKEDILWREKIVDFFKNFPNNVIDIWHYECKELWKGKVNKKSRLELELAIKESSID